VLQFSTLLGSNLFNMPVHQVCFFLFSFVALFIRREDVSDKFLEKLFLEKLIKSILLGEVLDIFQILREVIKSI
jgi:hypothetical protein